MNDYYVECLVARKNNPMLNVCRIGLYGLAVAFFILGFMGMMFLLVPALICAVLAYVVIPMFDLEYEYLYVNKEITVDKIMAKERRKNVDNISLENMEVMAPFISHELDSYKARNLQVVDYSSKIEGHRPFGMVVSQNGMQRIVIFEPNEEMIKAIKSVCPRKVVEY